MFLTIYFSYANESSFQSAKVRGGEDRDNLFHVDITLEMSKFIVFFDKCYFAVEMNALCLIPFK